MATLQFKQEGAPRVVRFDINALDDVERYLGAEVRDFFKDGTIGLKIRATRALLWGALKGGDSLLTPPAVGDLMQAHLNAGGTMADVYAAVFQALADCGVLRQPSEKPENASPNAESPAPPAA